MKMVTRIKRKWLKALRLGKYKQGIEYLKNDGKYCCLGVLCDIYAKEKRIKWSSALLMNASDVLPAKIVTWAGLDSDDPEIGKYQATDLNDGIHIRKQSFKQIANSIEKHL